MLWTPNPKTVEAVRLCERCGGIDRKHYAADRRDMRRYMSFHRACCCGGCPGYVQLVLSGVDASECVGCIQNAITSISGIDGTYILPANEFIPNSFELEDTFSGSAENNFPESDCGGTPLGSGDALRLNLAVVLDEACASVEGVSAATVYEDVGSFHAYRFDAPLFGHPNGSLGSSLSNDADCVTTELGRSTANGGTATVTKYTPP